MIDKVFIVVEQIPYEGTTIMKCFKKKDAAEKHASELQGDDPKSYISYDVEEWDLN